MSAGARWPTPTALKLPHHPADPPDMRPSGASCLLLAAAFLPAAARATLVVEPTALELRLDGGACAETTLVLRNTSADTLRVRAAATDFRIGPDGGEETLPPGEAERSCAGWITLPAGTVRLAPGESRRVEVRVAVPVGVTGSHWARIRLEADTFCRITEVPRGIAPFRRALRQTVAVPVLYHAPGPVPEAELAADVRVHPAGSAAGLLVLVENGGDRLLRCSGRLELRDGRGRVVRKLSLGDPRGFLLPPTGRRELLVQPGPLEPGAWSALAVVDVGGPHLLAGEARFEVPPRD